MLSSRRRNLVATLAAGALVVAGCGGDDGGTTPTVNPSSATQPSGSDPEPGDADGDGPEVDGPTTVDPGGDGEAAGPDDLDSTDGETGNDDAVTAAPEILQIAAPLIGGGGEFDLATVGDRPVLLWFWSPF